VTTLKPEQKQQVKNLVAKHMLATGCKAKTFTDRKKAFKRNPPKELY